jgi:hypothetical protein
MSRLSVEPKAPPVAARLPAGIVGTHALDVEDGVVLVGSDPHWTVSQPTSTATKAFVQLTARFAEEGSLRAVILAGDLPNFGQISRHPPLGWEKPGSLAEELAIVNERLAEIKSVAGLGIPLVRVKGNHCARYDVRLATVAPEFAGVRGFALDEQLDPDWWPCMVVEINPGPFGLIVKHRHKGGANAARGNATAAGKSIASGHTHQPTIVRLSNAATRSFWGVDLGTMAALHSDSFAFTEGAAATGLAGWASSFGVFSFVGSRLLWPELVHVTSESEGLVAFRGELLNVNTQH